MNKKGDLNWDIVISLILGIIIIALVLFFLFREYFTQEIIDDETCRQSIVLRSGAINNAVKTIQENFPFKCKTKVVDIDFDVPDIKIGQVNLKDHPGDVAFLIKDIGDYSETTKWDLYIRFNENSEDLEKRGDWEFYTSTSTFRGDGWWNLISVTHSSVAYNVNEKESSFIISDISRKVGAGFDKYKFLVELLKGKNFADGQAELNKITEFSLVYAPWLNKEIIINGKTSSKEDLIKVLTGTNFKISGLIGSEMVSCWSLLYEGKQPLYADNIKDEEYACFHCSRIHFSDKIKNFYRDLQLIAPLNVELYNGLNYFKLSDGKTYTKFLYPSVNSGNYADIALTAKKPENQDFYKGNFLNDINPSGGDVFVTFIYHKDGRFNPFSEDKYTFLVAYQSPNYLKCDIIETIPA